jgi:5-methyltetrahydropteroyltriglutamate--homocysteine methyltransferase
MADTYKFRIDHHGSLIRPAEVMVARQRHAAGELDDAGLRTVEDQAIAAAVKLQRNLGMTAVTDGDFRRADFRGAILETVSGFRRTGETDGHGLARWTADGELKAGHPLIADDTAQLTRLTVIAAKASLPSPAYLAARCFEGSGWKSAAELGEALAQIIRTEIELLIERGVRLIQLNNPGYARHLFARGGDVLSLDEAIAVDAIAAGLAAKPEDVRIGLCPTHRAVDAVDRAAAERLFSTLPVDRWVLPYSAGTGGEMDLLRAVPAGRDVCLGIVDPAKAELEDVDTIMDRMDVVAGLKDIEDVAVSPSAGFSDVAGRAAIGYEDQRRKLIHVETIARMCWGNEL